MSDGLPRKRTPDEMRAYAQGFDAGWNYAIGAWEDGITLERVKELYAGTRLIRDAMLADAQRTEGTP